MQNTTQLKDQLVTANRVLANEGIIEGFGHVSVRHPDGDKLLISRSLSPKLVTRDDIMTMTYDGTIVENKDKQPYLETVIHRAIYRNRDDVDAVVHHHAPDMMPFVATDTEIKPVFHLAALFHEGVPSFSDYDTEMGPLIVTEAEGDRMAAALGDKRAQLLENHGANVVGESLKEAVLGTVYLVMNARYQIQAEQLGTPSYFDGPQDTLEATVDDVILADISIDRMWSYLCDRLPNDPSM
ncbi:class II aldolase/adducin family protein [Natrinema soli]|uniref:Class II aldolase/adducin family protein n=1 Tax=Natrinema soli TaxID=1930624 RepID=A0ABD5SUN3_9EURY|nr:class II aldolase/adducin family protein [Natrinema soli]